MISVTELRNGATFRDKREIYQVLSYEHIKMGRGSANIKIKARNMRSGAIVERGYISGANVEQIVLENKNMQFLYKDQENAFFMNPETYEQESVNLNQISGHEFLTEGSEVQLQFFEGKVLGLVLSPKVKIVVSETAPGVKGNSTTNVYKDAKLANGMSIRVPLFINEGDSVVVDTRDGSYSKRA